MGAKRKDAYRTVEMVVHLGVNQRTVSVFAVRHNAGAVGRKLLWRGAVTSDMPVQTGEDILSLICAAAEDIQENHQLPWR